MFHGLTLKVLLQCCGQTSKKCGQKVILGMKFLSGKGFEPSREIPWFAEVFTLQYLEEDN